jgi:hypothetical protein
LEAAIDWSYRLLDERERRVFERLTVFMGGFDRHAARQVCGFDPIDPTEVDDVLVSLVDRSMILADRNEVVTRYSLLESLRQFGQLRLDGRRETDEVRARHAHHYVLHARAADDRWRAPGDGQPDDLFVREWDNLRAAHSWLIASDDVDNAVAVVNAVSLWAASTGTRPEVGDWVDRPVDLAELHTRVTPQLLGIASFWSHLLGDEERSVSLADAGIDLAADPVAAETASYWFSRMGAAAFLGRADTVVQDALNYLQAAEAAGDPFGLLRFGCYTFVVLDQESLPERLARFREVATALANPTTDAAVAYATLLERWRRGDLDEALALNDNAGQLARRAGNGVLVYNTIMIRVITSIERGQPDPRVPRAIRQLLSRMRHVPNPWSHQWWLIDATAGYLTNVGADQAAAELIGAFEANHQRPNLFLSKIHARTLERINNHDRVGDWLACGARLSADDALAYAEQQLESAVPPDR